MVTTLEVERAKTEVRKMLDRLLGPEHDGVTAFGVDFDPELRDLVVRVDLDPTVPHRVRDSIPPSVGKVVVEVGEAPAAEFE